MQQLMTGTEAKALMRAHLVAFSLMVPLDPVALTDYMIAAVPAVGLCIGCVLYCIFF